MTIFTKAAGIATAAAMLLGLGVAAATAQTPAEIKTRGTINIGMLVDFPPFGILDLQGQPDGYDADVAKLLAKDMGVEVNLVPVTGPNRIPYLLSNQVDILVASLGITEERAKQVDFSQAYAGIEIFVYGDKDVTIAAAADLSGKNVGVARASTQDTSITAVAPADTNIQRFDDDASAVQALLSGQVPLIGASNTVVAQVDQVAPGRFDTKFSLRRQSQGIATRPGSTEMMAAINDFLVRAKADGSLNELHQKWLSAPLPDFVTEAKK
jgi:polar amino acid transport system substrate-binding protein